MTVKTMNCVVAALLCLVGLTTPVHAGGKNGVWTDPKDPSLPVDFKVQGEYLGAGPGDAKVGAQVIALGKGAFQAVIFQGGLPGAGWDGKNRSLMAGKMEGDKAAFSPAAGKRKYLAQSPDEFSATSKFPPVGQIDMTGTITDGVFTLSHGEKSFQLKKIQRDNPNLGMKAPAGAIVLFDGTSTDEWKNGRLDKSTGLLNTDGKDIFSKRKFNDYTMHVEFLLPYRPDARGQGRGNSGFYQVHLYEVQILDSFGLEGMDNECGGVYTLVKPRLNMCLPPLAWQSYDVDFTNAVSDGAGKKVKNARLTCKLNGVVIQDDVELKNRTGGSRNDPEGTPGPILLQGHGNPLQFRNIWIVEKK